MDSWARKVREKLSRQYMEDKGSIEYSVFIKARDNVHTTG